MSIGFSGERSTTESQTTIAPRGADENALVALLRNVADASGKGFDTSALAALASGDLSAFAATSGDRALIEQATGAASDIASRRIKEGLKDVSRSISSDATARGIDQSSIEAALKALAGKEAVGRLADVESTRQGQVAEGLMSIPFQRIGATLGANQQLFQQLVSAASPVLEMSLRERLAEGKTRGSSQTVGMTTGYEIPGLSG